MLQDTEWKFSNEQAAESEYAEPVEGPQYLQIKKAFVSDDEMHYSLGMVSLTNNAYINIRYFLYATNDEGELVPDSKQRRTLITLKKALYGPEANGIPNPADIVGCVVMADVKLSKPTANGSRFPRIYSYKAVPGEVAASWGNPEQYAAPNLVGDSQMTQEAVDTQ